MRAAPSANALASSVRASNISRDIDASSTASSDCSSSVSSSMPLQYAVGLLLYRTGADASARAIGEALGGSALGLSVATGAGIAFSAFLVGYFLHLVADSLTEGGVPLDLALAPAPRVSAQPQVALQVGQRRRASRRRQRLCRRHSRGRHPASRRVRTPRTMSSRRRRIMRCLRTLRASSLSRSRGGKRHACRRDHC